MPKMPTLGHFVALLAFASASAFASPINEDKTIASQPNPTVEKRQTSTFKPAPGNFPKTGDDTIAGGIFCISLTDLPVWLAAHNLNGPGSGTESPRTAGGVTSGTGPYPAQMTTDPSLPNHTIYAPKTPPSVPLGFIAWGEGSCATQGNTYRNELTEIASYGFVIAADGPPAGLGSAQSKVQDMRDSLDWAFKGGAAKYGTIDLNMTATAGHSCGGLEAMSTAYHDDRVKRIIMHDIAIFQDEKRYLLQEIKVPVAWFVGNPTDMGYATSQKDYDLLNAGLPAFRASLDVGHPNTYIATNGGKFGKATVSYLEWQFRNNATAKAQCLDPKAPGGLVADKWTVQSKNWT